MKSTIQKQGAAIFVIIIVMLILLGVLLLAIPLYNVTLVDPESGLEATYQLRLAHVCIGGSEMNPVCTSTLAYASRQALSSFILGETKSSLIPIICSLFTLLCTLACLSFIRVPLLKFLTNRKASLTVSAASIVLLFLSCLTTILLVVLVSLQETPITQSRSYNLFQLARSVSRIQDHNPYGFFTIDEMIPKLKKLEPNFDVSRYAVIFRVFMEHTDSMALFDDSVLESSSQTRGEGIQSSAGMSPIFIGLVSSLVFVMILCMSVEAMECYRCQPQMSLCCYSRPRNIGRDMNTQLPQQNQPCLPSAPPPAALPPVVLPLEPVDQEKMVLYPQIPREPPPPYSAVFQAP